MVGDKYVLTILDGYSVENRFEIIDCVGPCLEFPLRTYMIKWFDGHQDLISEISIKEGIKGGRIVPVDPLGVNKKIKKFIF